MFVCVVCFMISVQSASVPRSRPPPQHDGVLHRVLDYSHVDPRVRDHHARVRRESLVVVHRDLQLECVRLDGLTNHEHSV